MCVVGEAVQSRLYAGECMRRSLTITPENDKKILLTKGRFLTGEDPLDIDYTTMANIFIELGHKLIAAAWANSVDSKITINKNEIIESFKKHAFSSELKEESVGDQVTEIIIKKLVDQAGIAGITQKSQDQQIQQLTSPPKTKSKERPGKRYII
ncbi:MAG: hypothetical protein FWE56_03630 [Candidatus Bathyarchaeota archaeon]|nr:hypothetical protein [Candidatus Termiticorpusculum sp.]